MYTNRLLKDKARNLSFCNGRKFLTIVKIIFKVWWQNCQAQ